MTQQSTKEKERAELLQFLTDNYVEEYMSEFVNAGVKKISHLKDVDAGFLKNLGMGEIAVRRFLKSIEEALTPLPSVSTLIP